MNPCEGKTDVVMHEYGHCNMVSTHRMKALHYTSCRQDYLPLCWLKVSTHVNEIDDLKKHFQ